MAISPGNKYTNRPLTICLPTLYYSQSFIGLPGGWRTQQSWKVENTSGSDVGCGSLHSRRHVMSHANLFQCWPIIYACQVIGYLALTDEVVELGNAGRSELY